MNHSQRKYEEIIIRALKDIDGEITTMKILKEIRLERKLTPSAYKVYQTMKIHGYRCELSKAVYDFGIPMSRDRIWIKDGKSNDAGKIQRTKSRNSKP